MTLIKTRREEVSTRRLLPFPPALLLYAILAAGLATAVIRFGPAIAAAASDARPHAPDMALFAAQPTVIQLHLLAALAALVVGAALMLWRKGRTFHRTAGWFWVVLMAVVAGSSFFIVGLNGGSWSFIHILSGWTAIALPLAVLAARRHEVKRHRGAMMGLFFGGLLLAGALNFIPGRLMWNLVLG